MFCCFYERDYSSKFSFLFPCCKIDEEKRVEKLALRALHDGAPYGHSEEEAHNKRYDTYYVTRPTYQAMHIGNNLINLLRLLGFVISIVAIGITLLVVLL